MKRLLLAVFLAGCSARLASSENPGREETDSGGSSGLTGLTATAEPEAEALGPVPIRARVEKGALHVRVDVGAEKECTFGQSDGPAARDASVNGGELALALDETDTHAWLYGGASIACEGDQPLFAWSLLDPKVSAPVVEVALEESADAMLSDEDTYVVRVRGHALEPVHDATLVIGSTAYAAKIVQLDDEITHWEMTFDVAPEKWVASVLHGENSARLSAHLESKDVEAAVTMGLEPRVTDASHQPLDAD